jgi:hypothetical protein
MSRYDRKREFDFNHAFGVPEPAKRRGPDPLEQLTRFASEVAPAAGAVAGGVLGPTVLPVLGTEVGAKLGMAAGEGLGAGGRYVADEMGAERFADEAERVAREEERRARAEAAMGLVGRL